MPNWCKGNLKIRGHIDDAQKFLEYCIYQKGKVLRNEYGDLELIDVSGHLKDTYRCFISNIHSGEYCPDNNGNIIVILRTEHAWAPKLEYFTELSKQFNVDFRFYGYEMGQQFNFEFEIIKGAITLEKEIKFDNYIWECPHPMLGG